MIKLIQKQIKNLRGSLSFFCGPFSPPRRRSGQLGLILILVAAVALVLYAVTLNIGKVSQGRVLTIIGANTAAIKLASYVASYGQSVFMTTLGGREEYCKSTSLLGLIIGLIIIIIIMLIIPNPTPMLTIGLLTAAAFQFAAIMINMLVIQPGITAMWNKMIKDSLAPVDQAAEMGVQTALMAAVTDNVNIPDLFDMDTDSHFGPLDDLDDKYSAPDYISRFAFYYTRRLQGIPNNSLPAVGDFIADLEEFLYEGTDLWGLFDPLRCSASPAHPCCMLPSVSIGSMSFPAMCDPCCVPDPDLRPACCDLGTCSVEGVRTGPPGTCAARSPYAAYPYVYSLFYEDSTNPFVSFHEALGIDDEHHLYGVNPAEPLWHYDIPDAVQIPLPVGLDGFYLEDASDFYPADDRRGIFPFFYKIADWGNSLADLTYGELPVTDDDYECHYCQQDAALTLGQCLVSLPAELSATPLVLPYTPNEAPWAGTTCVDNNNIAAIGAPPQLLDNVPQLSDVLAEDSVCAQTEGGWKRGGDRFCSTVWPYAAQCVKHGTTCTDVDLDTGISYPVDCSCGEAGAGAPTLWPDDNLDDVVYGLPEFYLWAAMLTGANLDYLEDTFLSWYMGAALWIECPCPVPPCDCSITEDPEGGALYIWRDELFGFYEPINDWINPVTPYIGNSCFIDSAADPSVWCIPPAQAVINKYGITECPGVNLDEQASFDISGDGRGSLEDVVACLDWNVNDIYKHPTTGAPFTSPFTGGDIVGNAEKFAACQYACENDPAQTALCTNLPRSLVPGMDQHVFSVGNLPDLLALSACASTSDIVSCNADCSSLPGGYVIPAFIPTSNDPALPVPNDSILGKLTTLYATCAANPSGTVTFQCRDGERTLDCDDPQALFECSCSWVGTSYLGTCEELCLGGGGFFDAVDAAIETIPSDCTDTAVGGFMDLLSKSVIAASNQVPKMAKRLSFLSARMAEAQNIRNILGRGLQEINDFLTGPAQELIDAYRDYDNLYPPSAESSRFAIYAWQDEPKDQYDLVRGDWHVVKVEVSVPDSSTWPYVKTWTKNWGTTRCYSLENRYGDTSARVVRYDEFQMGDTITFPDGTPLWQPWGHHPDSSWPGAAVTLGAMCEELIDPNIRGQSWEPIWGWENAFMINFAPTATSSVEYSQCWAYIHDELLRSGYGTSTCAMYYFTGSGGFREAFTSCGAGY